jgi:hypothetical protein
MINKVIHQIWIGEYKIPKRETSLFKDVMDKHPEYEYHLWTDNNLPYIRKDLHQMYQTMYDRKDYVFCADMIRWLVVYEYGGWYLDIDWECIKSLNEYDTGNADGVVFSHWGQGWKHIDSTIANNVFAFKKEHDMPLSIISNMPSNLSYSNPPYSPHFCGEKMRQYLGLSNDFTTDIWEYHSAVREALKERNILYGDYNTFQNENFRHHALFAWNDENMKKFANGEIE